MSTEQFQALIQQAKQLSTEERQQLMRYLTESEPAERSHREGREKEQKVRLTMSLCSALVAAPSQPPMRQMRSSVKSVMHGRTELSVGKARLPRH